MAMTGHKTTQMVRRYIREANIFKNNALNKNHSIKEKISTLNNNIEIIFCENNGYGSAINLGRKNIKTEYFFLFNPDIENVNDQVIEKIYLIAKRLKNKFCCIGPRFLNLSENIKQSDDKLELAKIPISGAAMFFNLITFDKLDGFDENFFLYFEENDFCKRGKKESLPSYQLNTAIVKHNIGTSVEYTDNNEKKKYNELCNWHFIWSKCYFVKKHYGYASALLIFFPILIKYYLYLLFFKSSKNTDQYKKYKNRIDAIISVFKGRKAYKRI